MLVTINTDASFHPQLKYGAYAFWAISNDFKITKSGLFKSKCTNSHDAEARCIVNALKVVLLAHKGISKVIINTDSVNSIFIFTNDKENIRKYLGTSQKMIKTVRNAYHDVLNQTKNKVIIEFRHVKAHSGINDKRSYVNEWCDLQAKIQLRKKIKQVNN